MMPYQTLLDLKDYELILWGQNIDTSSAKSVHVRDPIFAVLCLQMS